MSTIDIVMTAYNEKPEALEATLVACLQQSRRAARIFVVDDGSTPALSIPNACTDPTIVSFRMLANSGISAARNTAIQHSSASFIACINVEVLPQSNWLQVCADYLNQHPEVGACFTQLVPNKTDHFSQWRMRFHEQPYGTVSKPAIFAPGHAVLFRREAIREVGGYDEKFRRIGEDYDICVRMRQRDWEIHYVVGSSCTSIQNDTWRELARKQIGRQGIELERDYPLSVFLFNSLGALAHRLARNLFKGRISLAVVDFAVFFGSVELFVRNKQKASHSRGIWKVQLDRLIGRES